jgi:hypothetical protein
MRRPARDSRKAIDVFIAKKAEIDAMLARIAKLSEDHFGADPDKVNWGDVGTLDDYARHLLDHDGFGHGRKKLQDFASFDCRRRRPRRTACPQGLKIISEEISVRLRNGNGFV